MKIDRDFNIKKKNIPPEIQPAPLKQCYPVSLQQEGVFLQAMLSPDQVIWNISHSWRFEGLFDLEALKQAIQTLLNRHSSLRTHFRLEKDTILQYIRKHIPLDSVFKVIDLSSLRDAEKETAVLNQVEDEARRPYNLDKDPLVRFFLFSLSPSDHVMVVNKHHIISDVTSRRLLWKELVTLYNAAVSGHSFQLEALNVHYHDYAFWQQKFIQSPHYLKQKRYWLSEIVKPLPVLNIPTDFSRNAGHRTGISYHEVGIEPALLSELRSFSLRRRVSFSALFLLAYYILLFKYTNQSDMIVGTTYRGRRTHRQILKKILGLFANRLPLRLNSHRSIILSELLGRVDEKVRAAYENQDFLFEDLLRTIKPERNDRQAPIFQVVFNMVKLPDAREEFSGLTRRVWKEFVLDNDVSSNYDLSLYIRDNIEKLSFKILYSKDLFRVQTIERVSQQYYRLLLNIIRHPEIELAAIEILTEEEKYQILEDFNNTSTYYPQDKTIRAFFLEQVEMIPDHIAAVGQLVRQVEPVEAVVVHQITYRLLAEMAYQLANKLRDKGVSRDTIVAIKIERSINMIIGIYGILLIGAAYLPIDPDYPRERIRFIIEDSGARIVVTTEDVECIKVKSSSSEPFWTSTTGKPESRSLPGTCPVYLIYTSGSTGRPKGVLIEHHSMVNRLHWMQKNYPIGRNDTILQKTSYTFDVSVWEIFWWAMVGARVCMLVPGGQKDPEKIVNTVDVHRVTVMHFVPSMLAVFLDYIGQADIVKRLTDLRMVFSSGEALTPFLVNKFNRFLTRENVTSLVNLYGPTEASIDVSFFNCSPLNELENIPIGKPIDNIQLYVVNPDGQLQPIGIPGELCISGVGLARGYLNRPELTIKSFQKGQIKIPGSGILYRTGDLARWLPDGHIEFLGRIDFQVKIRGFRIELEEIEAQIVRHQMIKAAVVVAHERGASSSLVAYVVLSFANINSHVARSLELRNYLANQLPDYMIPSYFVYLDKLPLTSSGKINRKALPAPDGGKFNDQVSEPPQDDVQQKMVSVWEEVLGLKRVGIHDNFFIIGGDSIKAIQIISRLNSAGYRLDMGTLFRHPTIEEVSPHVQKTKGNIEQSVVTGYFEPIPIQKWFLQQSLTDLHYWNLSTMIFREEGFEPVIVEKVLNYLIFRHDLLRAVLSTDNKNIICKDPAEVKIPLEVMEPKLVQDAETWIRNESGRIQSSIDLYRGPLFKAALFKTPGGDHLLLVAHHLIIDGISWRILYEDFSSGYRQSTAGDEIRLPLKTHSFKYWSATLKTFSRSNKLFAELEYWRNLCEQAREAHSPVGQKQQGKLKDYHRLRFELTEEQSVGLLNKVHHAYRTEINDILLSGLALALFDCFDFRRILIFLEGHGREKISENVDVSRTVGWFTTQYPVFLEVREEDELGMHIRRTKEILRTIPRKGIGYGVLRYLADLSPEDRQALAIKPEVGFNYMGRFDEDVTGNCFTISPFSAGESKSPEAEQVFQININGRVEKSTLVFFINGDKKTYKKKEIEKLAERFKFHLLQIISHCQGVEFTVNTPGDFLAKNLTVADLDAVQKVFDSSLIDNIYNLSPMQEGMLFHHLYDPHQQAYIVQLIYQLEGEVEPDLIKKSYEELVQRYEVFRTAIVYKNVNRPRQVILKRRETEFIYQDVTAESDTDFFIEQTKIADRQRGFDLVKDILFRFKLFKIAVSRYILLVTHHHIIMDGWSTNLWLRDLISNYARLKNNLVPEWGVTHPYGNYIRWVEEQDMKSAHDYWREYLAGLEQVTRIESPGYNADVEGYEKGEQVIHFTREFSDELSAKAHQRQLTLNHVLLGAWSVILHRYCGLDDLVFGNVISGRGIDLDGVERIVGLFINTIPFRVKLGDHHSFTGILVEFKENLVVSQQYGYVPLAEIQAYGTVQGSLLEHLYIYENYPINPGVSGSQMTDRTGFKVNRKYSIENTNYHLYITIIPRQELWIRLQYNRKVYESTFIKRLASHVKNVIEQVALNPDQSIKCIEIITEDERREILDVFNLTDAEYPLHKTVLGLFEDQVEKSPDQKAITATSIINRLDIETSSSEFQVTYREFDQKARLLALRLWREGVGFKTIVAIMVERSLEMMVGIYGIIKAGGAYLPINPGYPPDRIRFMLDDSSARIVLKSEDIGQPRGRLDSSEVVSSTSNIHHACKLSGTFNPAYCIYTSGTTGRPKGVVIDHHSLVNRLFWMQKKYPIDRRDSILHKTPYTFDVSVWEIFWWGITGAGVCLPASGAERDPGEITKAIARHQVTVIHFVPSMLSAFLDCVDEKKNSMALSSLKQVIASGEALGLSLVNRFKRLLYHDNLTFLANLYGPTEAAIDVSFFDCPLGENIHQIPIGKPIDNIMLLVIGQGERLQPVEVPGELYIGGVGLARGYLNQPELTAERFVNNRSLSSRLHSFYKTGDLARFLPDGNLEFQGRLDQQVKVRGFRIELAEIESLLMAHPLLREVAVVARDVETGDPYLCAYVVSNSEQPVSGEVLRTYLLEILPDYMIPTFFVFVEELPLTANGKLDRRALPAHDKTGSKAAVFRPPANETEKELVTLWQDILKVDRVGIKDNFFRLGGHSLRVMTLVNQIYKKFGVEISIRQIFDQPTISEIAERIDAEEEKAKKLDKILQEIESMEKLEKV